MRLGDGTPLNGVTMTLSGASSATITTPAGGAYSFSGLTQSTYTVTPSKSGYNCIPASRTYAPLISDRSGEDYTCTAIVQPTYTISGTVRNAAGTAMSGATVNLNGDNIATVNTGAAGTFVFGPLPQGGYAVTASKAGYTCQPPLRAYTPLNANVSGEDFYCSPVVSPTYTIQGVVRTESGVPISGVTVNLTGTASAAVVTGAAGAYSFAGLLQGNYTVTPSKSGYSFTPANRPYTPLSSDRTADDFTGSTGSGQSCTAESAHPYADMFDYTWVCTVTGASAINVAFDSRTYVEDGWDLLIVTNGSGVPIAGSPFTGSALSGQTKTVPSDTVRIRLVSDQSVAGWGFRAVATPATSSRYTISGTVRQPDGTGLSGVVLVLSGSDVGFTTGLNGTYTFGNVPAGNYTVTPSKSGYTCVPVSRTYTPLNSDQTGQDYTCSTSVQTRYAIQGFVRDASGVGISGVVVTLSGATAGSVTTGSTGGYSFSNLVQGNYTVTPSKSGYTFSPSARVYSPLNSDRTADNFTGTPQAGGECTLESAHPYTNNMNYTWVCTVPGAAGLNVIFDSRTSVENFWDTIVITNGAGVPISGSPFTGTALAGQYKVVVGDTVRIRLTSDGSVTGWGFKATVVSLL